MTATAFPVKGFTSAARSAAAMQLPEPVPAKRPAVTPVSVARPEGANVTFDRNSDGDAVTVVVEAGNRPASRRRDGHRCGDRVKPVDPSHHLSQRGLKPRRGREPVLVGPGSVTLAGGAERPLVTVSEAGRSATGLPARRTRPNGASQTTAAPRG